MRCCQQEVHVSSSPMRQRTLVREGDLGPDKPRKRPEQELREGNLTRGQLLGMRSCRGEKL